MDRRRFLSIVGGGLPAVLSGCHGRPDDDETAELPDEFDAPEYASRFTPRGPWRMVGHDPGRTGYAATSQLPVGDTGAAWLRWVGETFPTVPVTDDRHVYVGHAEPGTGENESRGTVTALDGRTGEKAWSTTLAPPEDATEAFEEVRPEGLVRTGGNVYVVAGVPDTGTTRIAALDATDGGAIWETTVPGIPSAGPGSGDGAIYVPVGGHDGREESAPADGALYAFELDGTERWRYRFEDTNVRQPVCVADGVVYAGLADGRVIAFDGRRRALLWERSVVDYEPGSGVPIQETPAVDDERVYVAGVDRFLYAISREDGSTEWSLRLRDVRDGWVAAPAVGAGTVYCGAARAGLYALDPSDGAVRWHVEEAPVFGQIAIADRGVVSGSRGTVRAFDHDGEDRWTFEMEIGEAPGDAGYVMAPQVLVAHDLVYVRLADGRLYAVGSRS